MKKLSIALLAMATAVAIAPIASADTILTPTPGSSSVPAGTALATVSGSATSVGGNPYTVQYTESVYTYNVAGDLAFVYTAKDTGGDFIDAFSTDWVPFYSNATVDNISGSGLTEVIEDITDGSISAGFSPALFGTNSTEFVLYTDATTYEAAPLYFQDGSQVAVDGLGPAPEPSSLFLLGTGLLGLAFLVFRKSHSASGLSLHS
ncbi:MAG: PEP-CTERM sorting domain-containing protein [Terracidiphilus sp.]|jgi:hypothetical protein